MNDFLCAPRPIRSVLIANRGEIACRIIATCRKLGLRTVAVHSDADAGARHVLLADKAERIGANAPSQSYLNIDAILQAAKRSGADAIHPGYGFVSENAEFSRACAENGLIFIGPAPDAVAAMGSKIEARRIAEAAGLPIVPGYQATGASLEDFAQAADRIGFPIMVKASAGGGGRGMRRVETAQALEAAISSAKAEAGSAFGDDTLFIEKLILSPRHLEVQIFGDGNGEAFHFFERDCSVQRNHQKLIEEAPAPNLPEYVRQNLFDSALKLTRAINYAGAGTVEFIMAAGSDEPYFLEMNTRLQVEHPVTEEICGVDLVELQIRQAAGLPLNLSQEQIRSQGHSIEVRINAERPDLNFLPQTGHFIDVVPPPGLRFESGVEAGSEVGAHYDSMLAKLIAHGPDRASALDALIGGLKALAMPGVPTNQAFLADCLAAKSFVDGEATTAFLSENFADGWSPDPARLLHLRALAAHHAIEATAPENPLQRTDGFRLTSSQRPAGAPLHIADDFAEVELNVEIGAGTAENSRAASARFWRDGDVTHACHDGLSISATVRPLAEARLDTRASAAQAGHVIAPLTGLVSFVHVSEGARVKAGDPLVEMEAMKLVHSLLAPFDGTIARISCRAGETLTARTVLVEMEEEAA
jgi:3-methylcrotonyl-CoA carboxylase alpha subunit